LRDELGRLRQEEQVWKGLLSTIPHVRLYQLCKMYDELDRVEYPVDSGYVQDEYEEILRKKDVGRSILAAAAAGILHMNRRIKRIESETQELGVHCEYSWQMVVQGRLDAEVLRRKMKKLRTLHDVCETHMKAAEARSDKFRADLEDRADRAVSSYMASHPWDDDDDVYRNYMEDHEDEDPFKVHSFLPFGELVDFILDEAHGPCSEVDMASILPKWNGKSDAELDAELVNRFGYNAATVEECAKEDELRYRSILCRCAYEATDIAQRYFPVA
jgi:hypothetical protein